MNDTIIFMSAYKTTEFKKHFRLKRKQNITDLLEKYHFDYMFTKNAIISSEGNYKVNSEFDYVRQCTNFTFSGAGDKGNSSDNIPTLIRNKAGLCVKLLHAYSVLLDPMYFEIEYIFCAKSFLVFIDGCHYQIDPFVFSFNDTTIIGFEVIDYKTGKPLTKDNIGGKTRNFNLIKVEKHLYFEEQKQITAGKKIPEIIYDNVVGYFEDLVSGKFVSENYSFLHDTLVISNEIEDISDYFCTLIGIKALPSPLVNISTVDLYDYYIQDSSSVITNSYVEDNDDIDTILYSGIILESLKLYIYLSQYIALDSSKDINKEIYNDMYLDNLFCAPNFPIETHNLLDYLHKTSTFTKHKEAVDLKIKHMTIINETRKNNNTALLNVLIYFLSLISSIGTLDILESRFGLPFNYSFAVVVLAFLIFGIVWFVREHKHNKRP